MKINYDEVSTARKILGKKADNLSDLEVQQIIAKMKYLADIWLNQAEKRSFNGSTIDELLNKELL